MPSENKDNRVFRFMDYADAGKKRAKGGNPMAPAHPHNHPRRRSGCSPAEPYPPRRHEKHSMGTTKFNNRKKQT